MGNNKVVIGYLNIARTISILMVVFCHMVLLKNDGVIDNIAMLLCWACVPIFFLVNGALLFNKELDLKKHYKKTIKIYIVLIIWKIIYLIIFQALHRFNIDEVSKINIIKYIFLFGKLKGISTDHLYFIESLIAIYIVFPVIYQSFSTKEGKNALIVLCCLLFIFKYGVSAVDFFSKYIINNTNISISGLSAICVFGGSFHYLLFFILGGIIQYYNKEIQKIKFIKIITFFLIIISLLGLIFVKYKINNTVMWKYIYLENGYGRLSTFVMSISMFVFLQNINIKNTYINKVFQELGSSTLGIYYMHIPILYIASKYIYVFIENRGVIINLIKTIAVVFVCYIFTKILKKIPIVNNIVK